MGQECATPAKTLNQSEGTEGMWPNPPPVSATTANSMPPAFPPWSQTKTDHNESSTKDGWPEVYPVPFLNPDPIAHLVGHSNEALVIVDGQEMAALIDLGAHVSSISSQFCEDLQIQPLSQLLELEGTGGSTIPYLRFMEVNLQIPGIKNYNEVVLLLVIPTMTYSETVLVMVGSKIIDRAMSAITKGELMKATTTWRQAHFGAVMSGSLQLLHTSSNAI